MLTLDELPQVLIDAKPCERLDLILKEIRDRREEATRLQEEAALLIKHFKIDPHQLKRGN